MFLVRLSHHTRNHSFGVYIFMQTLKEKYLQPIFQSFVRLIFLSDQETPLAHSSESGIN